MVRRTIVVVLVLSAAGCAGDPVVRARLDALVAMDTAVGQQRYADAEVLARRFAARADVPLDERCSALLDLGRALEGQQRHDEALDVLASVGPQCASVPEASARGLLAVGNQALRRGDKAVAARTFERVVTAFPDDPAAQRAADEVRDLHREAGGNEAAIEALRRLYVAVPDRAVSPYLLFQAARVVLSAPAPAPEARSRALALFRRITDAHAGSPQANDALLAAAREASALGRPSEAAELLERLLEKREWSFLLGSYELSLYADAAFLRAEVAAQAREAPAAVVEWYDAFARKYPNDARAPLARLRAARAVEASGDRSAYLERLSRLAEDCPDTPAGRWAAATLAHRDPGPEPTP